MKNRVTMRFTSHSGNDYLYDDATSMIFPWSGLLETILTELESRTPDELAARPPEDCPEDVWTESVRRVDYWKNTGGAFYREPWNGEEEPDYTDFERTIGSQFTNQLILSVTDDCNLRCKYCIYSDEYSLTKNKTCNQMSTETARKALDYFYRLIEPQLKRNPRKKFGLTFYGGEPLMNFEAVQFAVEYAERLLGDRVYFMMTSNGLLLTDRVADFLQKHEVGLAISIDGPQEEHDRLRVNLKGGGSFQRIKHNVDRLRENYPDYYRRRVNAVCVYDFLTDVEKVEQFYEQGEQAAEVPRAVFVNRVSDANSNYYDQFTRADIEAFLDKEERLREKYITQKTEGCPTSSYLNSIIGSSALSIVTRRRALDGKSAYIPTTGSCVPGQKICVSSNGNLDICERVNGTNPIGHIDSGLHIGRVTDIVSDYRRQIAAHCDKCPGQKLCGLCFVNFETDGGFEKQPDVCANHMQVMRNHLSIYTSICERNPDAEFMYSSDTIELDRPLAIF